MCTTEHQFKIPHLKQSRLSRILLLTTTHTHTQKQTQNKKQQQQKNTLKI